MLSFLKAISCFPGRLLVAQYPHLCIIEDWLEETVKTKTIESTAHTGDKACTIQQFRDGMLDIFLMHSDWQNTDILNA